MKNILFLTIFLLSNIVFSQDSFQKKTKINNSPKLTNIALKKVLKPTLPFFKVQYSEIDTLLSPSLSPIILEKKESFPNFNEFFKYKRETKLNYNYNYPQSNKPLLSNDTYIKYILNANLKDEKIPLDNSIACSDKNFIVSVTNGIIEYWENNRFIVRIALKKFLNNQLSFPGDPKVIFDPVEKKFIFFAQECNIEEKASEVIVGFSISNNPLDGWYLYKLPGNPLLQNDLWFDYPKIGISDEDLFISGNLFNKEDRFVQTILFQINKRNCFIGGKMSSLVWFNFSDNPFTLLPISSGTNLNYGPGIFLLSTTWERNSKYFKFYDVTGNVSSADNQINYFEVPTNEIKFFAEAEQKGGLKIDNGDLRIQDGFFINDKIVFVYTSGDANSNFSKISLNIFDIVNFKNKQKLIGENNNESYCFPSVCSIYDSDTIKYVVHYCVTSDKDYPCVRYAVGDEFLNLTDEILIEKSKNNILNNSRWGDYSSASKSYSTSNDIWLSSSIANLFGQRQTLISCISQKNDSTQTVYTSIDEQLITIFLTIKESSEFQLILQNENIKFLVYEGKIGKGSKEFLINKKNLKKGKYLIKIVDVTSKKVVNEQVLYIDNND
jgi:hypothetical protein